MDGLFPEHVSRLGPPSCPRWDVEGDTPVCAGSLGLCHGQELRERTTRSPLRARDGQTGGPARRAHGSERQAEPRKDVRAHLRRPLAQPRGSHPRSRVMATAREHLAGASGGREAWHGPPADCLAPPLSLPAHVVPQPRLTLHFPMRKAVRPTG